MTLIKEGAVQAPGAALAELAAMLMLEAGKSPA